jgi:hypothetical protein
MRIQTPDKFSRFGYFGLDTRARVDDELLALAIGRFYVGIYPTRSGYDLSVGIVDKNGAL